jgi:hypothetical protein
MKNNAIRNERVMRVWAHMEHFSFWLIVLRSSGLPANKKAQRMAKLANFR